MSLASMSTTAEIYNLKSGETVVEGVTGSGLARGGNVYSDVAWDAGRVSRNYQCTDETRYTRTYIMAI